MKEEQTPTPAGSTAEAPSKTPSGADSAPSKSPAPKWRALTLLPPRMASMLNSPLYRTFAGIGRNRDEVLRWAGVEEGQDILELGPGGGYYTPLLAQRVGPKSKVYAVDIQKEMIDKVRQQVEKAGVENVVPMVADGARLPLSDGAVDMVFALYMFEEVVDLQGVVAEVARVLRPGGTLVIAQVAFDFKQDQKEAMRHFIPLGGFDLIDEDDGRWTYRVRYRKKG